MDHDRAVEDTDEQIARLESAELGEIRHGLRHRGVATLAGRAGPMARSVSMVVGIGRRRRRRSALPWGGGFGGIAASVLVTILVVQSHVPGDDSEPAPRAPAVLAFGPAERAAELAAASVRQRDHILQAQSPAPPSTSRTLAERERVADDSRMASKQAAGLLGHSQEAAPSAEEALAPPQTESLTALLLVDPAQAPEQLRSQPWSAGSLAGRLEAAQRIAGHRPVIALFTVESAAGALALCPGAAAASVRPAAAAAVAAGEATGAGCRKLRFPSPAIALIATPAARRYHSRGRRLHQARGRVLAEGGSLRLARTFEARSRTSLWLMQYGFVASWRNTLARSAGAISGQP